MKNTILCIATAAMTLVACNNNSKSTENAGAADEANQLTATKNTTPISGMIAGYLQVKNALASDNGEEAAVGGKAITDAMEKFDKASLTGDQQKVYEEVEADLKENAEHIDENADKIDHQREHFEMLSKDMYDLVKAFGAGQTLYKDFCPMYNDNKGAFWLSETEKIKNPYLGGKMPGCGDLKEIIKGS